MICCIQIKDQTNSIHSDSVRFRKNLDASFLEIPRNSATVGRPKIPNRSTTNLWRVKVDTDLFKKKKKSHLE